MPRLRSVFILLVVVALVSTAGFARAASGTAPLERVSPPHGGYSPAPPTHLWWLPGNAIEKAEVVISRCIGCVSKHFDGRTPDPAGMLPSGVAHTYRIDRWEFAYEAFASDDPYPDNGLIIVLRQAGKITGSLRIDLWLPQAQHALDLGSSTASMSADGNRAARSRSGRENDGRARVGIDLE